MVRAEAESGSRPRSAEGGGSYGQYVYASFPVDVIVHFHMQPSTFRFSCLPASRVECLLQLPSLQIVFSSKRAEELVSYINKIMHCLEFVLIQIIYAQKF
jgi:hypothetical protein